MLSRVLEGLLWDGGPPCGSEAARLHRYAEISRELREARHQIRLIEDAREDRVGRLLGADEAAFDRDFRESVGLRRRRSRALEGLWFRLRAHDHDLAEGRLSSDMREVARAAGVEEARALLEEYDREVTFS